MPALWKSCVVLALLAGVVAAQRPQLEGTYRNMEPTGGPISDKGTFRTHFAPILGTSMLIGITTFDEGAGPVLINDPAATYLVAPHGTSAYQWVTLGEEFGGLLHPEGGGFYMEYTHGDGGEDQVLEPE